MKKNYIILTVSGLLLLAIGLYIIITVPDPKGIINAALYICLVLGFGIFGKGFSNTIAYQAIKKSPKVQKQMEINRNDERNIAICNRAKAKAYDFFKYVFWVLLLTFAFMGVNNIAILLLAFAYLIVMGYGVFYRIKFDKEM